jgi:PAS domain S-box-containing protein
MNFIELAICNGSSMADDRNANNKTKITAEGPVFRSETPINILIVDDEPRNLTALEAILDDPGYRLVRADSAEQALLSLLVDEFALLVLDIRMPAVTGLELAQMIRARKKTANVPIIFLTAYYGDDQDVVEGYEAGGIDYVRKPVNPAILRSKVGLFAELYRKQRKLEETNRVLAAVVESCDDAIISTDLAGIVATFNPGAERLFGYKAEEVVGKPVTILIPPDRQHEEPEILARIRRGERLDQYETVRRRKNGTLVDVSLTVSSVKDDQGRVIGASKIARDITRNSREYAFLIRLCEFIFWSLMPDEQSAETRFQQLLDDEIRMSAVFQDFLYNFFQFHHTEYRVKSESLRWYVTDATQDDLSLLPRMVTDITLRHPGHTIIVEAKFYRKALAQGPYGERVWSQHLYQLVTYLQHERIRQPDTKLCGMLVYPNVGRSLRLRYRLLNVSVLVATVDLGQEWLKIEAELQGLLDDCAIVANLPGGHVLPPAHGVVS